MRKIILIFAGIVLAVIVVVAGLEILEAWVGNKLIAKGHFTLMTKNLTEIYDTAEFTVTATMSAQGLRNRLVNPQKSAGTTRILVLGDSFTFGWGVGEKETWPALLEKKMREEGKSVEVVNAAAPGMTVDSETLACRIYKTWFKPDMIVLGVYVTDDLYQIAAEDELNRNLLAQAHFRWPLLSRLTKPVLMKSWHEGNPGETKVSSREWRRRAGANLSLFPEFFQKFNPEVRGLYLGGKLNPSVISFADHAPNYLIAILDQDARNQAIGLYDKYLAKFIKRCGKDLPVLAVVLPADELVSEFYQNYRQEEGYLVDRQLLTLDLETPLSQIFSKRGMRFISLISDFRNDECLDCYYPWDMHLTAKGQARVAEKTFGVLKELIK